MVEKRRPCLKRVRHRRDVYFYEQVIRQIRHLVCEQGRIERSRAVRLCEPAVHIFRSILGRHRGGKIFCIQISFCVTIECGHPTKISFGLWQICRLKESLGVPKPAAFQLRCRQQIHRKFDKGPSQRLRQLGICFGDLHRRVPLVSAKALIAAVAVERNGHMFAGLFCYIICRYRARIRVRFTVMFDKRWNHFHRIRAHYKFVVFRTDIFGYPFGVFKLAEILLFETYSKCLDRLCAFLRHQGDDDGRINAA